jgi:hypothetical protein
LFLDALDEDPAAIQSLPERLSAILRLTRDFRTVLISCRTQFFSTDTEMPRKTGIMTFGPLAVGEQRELEFYKLYLSPFDDFQIAHYLRLRYPLWQQPKRAAARQLVAQLADLTARPMILAHIDDLLASGARLRTLGELYRAIVSAWLTRESVFVDADHLHEFSKHLAVDLVLNRSRRGGEKISAADLSRLAQVWKILLDTWKLTGRSLLNRDADGNYKFAHRSLMEYLFAQRLVECDPACLSVEWTDLIRQFVREFLTNALDSTKPKDIAFRLDPHDTLFVRQVLARFRPSPMDPVQPSQVESDRNLHALLTAGREALSASPFIRDYVLLITELLVACSGAAIAVFFVTESRAPLRLLGTRGLEHVYFQRISGGQHYPEVHLLLRPPPAPLTLPGDLGPIPLAFQSWELREIVSCSRSLRLLSVIPTTFSGDHPMNRCYFHNESQNCAWASCSTLRHRLRRSQVDPAKNAIPIGRLIRVPSSPRVLLGA